MKIAQLPLNLLTQLPSYAKSTIILAVAFQAASKFVNDSPFPLRRRINIIASFGTVIIGSLIARCNPIQTSLVLLCIAYVNFYRNKYSPEQFNTLIDQGYAFPPNPVVVGDLELFDKPNLTFPAGLSVMGSLYIENCGFNTFPAGITVRNSLRFIHCEHLTSVEPVKLGADLYLHDCPQITALPNWIHLLKRPTFGFKYRFIYLTNTGIPLAYLDQLMEVYPHVDRIRTGFYFLIKSVSNFNTLKKALNFWKSLSNIPLPELQVPDHNLPDVLSYLRRLIDTKEYENENTRAYLAERILNVFTSISQTPALQETAFTLIEEAVNSCNDGIISVLGKLEILFLIHTIENSPNETHELRQLGRRLLLLRMVNQKALEYVQTRPGIDEEEVILAFQITLTDKLNLPISTSAL